MKSAKLLSLATLLFCLGCSKEEPTQQAFTLDKIRSTSFDDFGSHTYFKSFENGEVYAFFGFERTIKNTIAVDRMNPTDQHFTPFYRGASNQYLTTLDVVAIEQDYAFSASNDGLFVCDFGGPFPGTVQIFPLPSRWKSGVASSYGDHAIISMNNYHSVLFAYNHQTRQLDTALALFADGTFEPEIYACKVFEHEGQIKYALMMQELSEGDQYGPTTFYLINAETDSIERQIPLGLRYRQYPQEGLLLANKLWFWIADNLVSVDLSTFYINFIQMPGPIRNGKALGPVVAENGDIILHTGGLTSVDPVSSQINWSNSASWYVPSHDMRYPDYFLAWEGDLKADPRLSLRVFSHANGQPVGHPLLNKFQSSDYSLSAFVHGDKLFVSDGWKELSTYRLTMQP